MEVNNPNPKMPRNASLFYLNQCLILIDELCYDLQFQHEKKIKGNFFIMPACLAALTARTISWQEKLRMINWE